MCGSPYDNDNGDNDNEQDEDEDNDTGTGGRRRHVRGWHSATSSPLEITGFRFERFLRTPTNDR